MEPCDGIEVSMLVLLVVVMAVVQRTEYVVDLI